MADLLGERQGGGVALRARDLLALLVERVAEVPRGDRLTQPVPDLAADREVPFEALPRLV